MKLLIYVNHFFGRGTDFIGKSSYALDTGVTARRKRAIERLTIVEQVVGQLKKIHHAEVKICGITGHSLIDPDITFNAVRKTPLLLAYESLNDMANHVHEYDYFINLEDDVFLPEITFENIVAFDEVSAINEILLPNRLEWTDQAEKYCVDLLAIPGWTQQRKVFENHQLRVALNPHSGLLILSQEKFKYALKQIDRKFRGRILHNEIDSAFAYFHSSFSLFRSEDLDFHFVKHLDKWINSPKSLKISWWERILNVKAGEFIPPIFVRLFRFIKRNHH